MHLIKRKQHGGYLSECYPSMKDAWRGVQYEGVLRRHEHPGLHVNLRHRSTETSLEHGGSTCPLITLEGGKDCFANIACCGPIDRCVVRCLGNGSYFTPQMLMINEFQFARVLTYYAYLSLAVLWIGILETKYLDLVNIRTPLSRYHLEYLHGFK